MYRPLAALAFIVAASASSAQAPAPRELSLKDAVALAFQKSPVLQSVQAQVPGAQARLDLARSAGRLTASTTTFLSTGTMTSHLSSVPPVMPDVMNEVPNEPYADQNLMVTYPLSTGGRVGAETAAAGADLQGAQAQVDTELLDLAYQVRRGYWQVLLNREMVKIAQENLKEQQESLRVDQVSFDAGKIPLYYVLRDKAEVADAQQSLTNATRDVDTALLGLREALGVDMDQPLALTDALVYESAAPGDPAALTVQALKLRPAAQAAQAQVDAAARQVQAQRAAYRPQLALDAMGDAWKASGSDLNGGYTAALVASLPLLDGGSRRAEVKEAQAGVNRAQADLATVKLAIARQVHEALLDYAAADQNVRTAEAALASAEEDYRVALVRYQAGKAINLERIEALAVLVRARTNYAQAIFAQRVALDAVYRAVGHLPL
jgi:outer membrane protein TolC